MLALRGNTKAAIRPSYTNGAKKNQAGCNSCCRKQNIVSNSTVMAVQRQANRHIAAKLERIKQMEKDNKKLEAVSNVSELSGLLDARCMAFNSIGTQENFTDRKCTVDEWRSKAEALWALLDDISTASDMFKPEQTNFYKYVMRKCEERSKQMISDGYRLYAI